MLAHASPDGKPAARATRATAAAPPRDRAVVIRMRDGRSLTCREEINRGSSAKPLSQADVLEKFRQTASRALPAAKVEQTIRDVLDLESMASAEDFVSALGPCQLA